MAAVQEYQYNPWPVPFRNGPHAPTMPQGHLNANGHAVPPPTGPLIPEGGDDDDFFAYPTTQTPHHIQTQNNTSSSSPPLSSATTYASSLSSTPSTAMSSVVPVTPLTGAEAPFVFDFEYPVQPPHQQPSMYPPPWPSSSSSLPRLQLNPQKPATTTTTTILPNGLNLPTTTTSEQKAPVLSLSTIARQIASNAAAQRSLAPRGRGQPQTQKQGQHMNPKPALYQPQHAVNGNTSTAYPQVQAQMHGQALTSGVQASSIPTLSTSPPALNPLPPSLPLIIPRRPNGACTRCKKMKMKCTFPDPSAPTCLRCLTSNVPPNQPCTVEGRKPRTPSQREALLAKIREKDAVIARLVGPWVREREEIAGGGGEGAASGGGGVMLAGGKVIAALEAAIGGTAARRSMSWSISGTTDRGTPARTQTFPALGPTERAALMSAEKGTGAAGASAPGSGKKGPLAAVKKEAKVGAGGGGDDSDEEWSSGDESEEGDDVWDEEVERRWGEVDPSYSSSSPVNANRPTPTSAPTPCLPMKPLPTSGHLQLLSLPPRHSPLGLIARLSLEEGGVRGVGSVTGSVFGKSVARLDGSMTPTTPSYSPSSPAVGVRAATTSSLRKRLFPPDDDDSDQGGDGDSEDDDWWNADADGVDAREEELYGIASPEYFHPGPGANLALRRVLNARGAPPPILATGLISWDEVQELFDIFFTKISVFVSLLDESLHTPHSTLERDPFLFTVVCAISSRYLTSRPNLHHVAMHFAKTAAASALIGGTKSIEMAQAYLLLAVYGLPARRWEEDRAWFYGGLASRIATDLALSRTSSSVEEGRRGASVSSPGAVLGERHAREKLNRIRTWLNCWNVDRSSSTQFGKPTGLEEEEVVKRATEVAGGRGWWRGSEWNHRYDVHMVWYTELLRVMSRFHERVYAVKGKQARNLRAITEMTEQELTVWRDRATESYARDSDPSDRACVFRARGLSLFENYMRLVMYSFGFEEAWKKREENMLEPGDMFFVKCLQCATSVVKQLCEYAGHPGEYMKYAPDCYFVMGGFSGAFLLKMLRPEFSVLIDKTVRERIISQIQRFVDVLASEKTAINETHTSMLYAKFLHTQLKRVLHPEDKAPAAASQQQTATPRPQQTFKQEEPETEIQLGPPMDSAAGSGAATPRNNKNAALPSMGEDRNTPTPGDYASSFSVQTPGTYLSVQTPAMYPSAQVPSAYASAQTPGGYASAYSTPSSTQAPGVPALDNFDWTAFTTSYTSNDWSGANNDYDAMELCDDDYLATMQAVTSEQWMNSVLMPGFRLPSPPGMIGSPVQVHPMSPVQQQQYQMSSPQQQYQMSSPQQQYQMSSPQQQYQMSTPQQQQQYQEQEQQYGMPMWN